MQLPERNAVQKFTTSSPLCVKGIVQKMLTYWCYKSEKGWKPGSVQGEDILPLSDTYVEWRRCRGDR